MPHDRKGVVLAVGDVVNIPTRIKSITLDEHEFDRAVGGHAADLLAAKRDGRRIGLEEALAALNDASFRIRAILDALPTGGDRQRKS